MTTTEDTVLFAPAVRRQPLAVCVLAAVAVVVGWVAYRHWLLVHVQTWVLNRDFIVTRWWLLNLVSAILLCAPYALALLVWGRTTGRRVAGALVALGAGVYIWAVFKAFSDLVWKDAAASESSGKAFSWVTLLGVAVLVPLAWGVARRHGRAWVAGLVVGPAVAAVLFECELHSSWWLRHVTLDSHSYHWIVQALVYVAPFVLGALACWWVEVVTARRSNPEMGSSA